MAAIAAAVMPACGGEPERRSPPPPPPPAADLFVAPSGKDRNPCTRKAPCRSFDRAYRLSQPGDHVEVAGGRYRSQRIYPDETKQSPEDVVFRPAAGERVVVKRYLSPWASHVTVKDMVAEGDLFIVGERITGVPQRDVSAIGISAAGLQIDGASNVTVQGGSFGGTPERPTTWNSGIRRSTKTMPSDIVIDGARFQDVRCARDEPNCHIECLIVGAVDGLTVRDSEFTRCPILDMFFEPFNGPIRDVRLERNRFARPTGPDGTGESAYSVQLKNCDCRYDSFVVRENVLDGALGMGGDTAAVSNSIVEGNTGVLVPHLGEARCGSSGILYRDNRWAGGLTCGPSDRQIAAPAAG
jgi:hypothetical protein